MPSTIILQKENKTFRTAYRPILINATDTIGDVAYLKAELLRESGNNTGSYIGTGIYLNAYEDFGGSGEYTFNAMGYCRELISGGFFSKNPNGLGGSEIGTRFKLRVSAVRYSNTANQPLIDDNTDYEESEGFFALPTTTNELQGLDPYSFMPGQREHHDIHRLVLGDNRGGSSSEINYHFSQNTPTFNNSTSFLKNFHSSAFTKAYTINRKDARNDGIYVPVALTDDWDEFWVYVVVINQAGSVVASSIFEVSTTSDLHTIPCHPDALNNYITGYGGSVSNTIINTSGDLVAKGVAIYPMVFNSTTNDQKLQKDNTGQVRPHFIDFSEEDNNGKCNRNKFVFRNTSGAYDWINIYGEEDKTTTFDSVIYDSIPDNGASNHTRKTLYNSREDVFTVNSQPVGRDVGRHIEELINSSLVWVNKKFDTPIGGQFRYTDCMLVPILIVPGSFEIYNTENNISFIKFSYTFSEQITSQKG